MVYQTYRFMTRALEGQRLRGFEIREKLIEGFEGDVPDGRLLGRNKDFSLRQGLVRSGPEDRGAHSFGMAPNIRFDSTTSGVSITGFGDETLDLLARMAPAICDAFARSIGIIDQIDVKNGSLSIKRTDKPQHYRASRIIIQKFDRPGLYERGRVYQFDDVIPGLKRAIAGGIISRCQFFADASQASARALTTSLPDNLDACIEPVAGRPTLARIGNRNTLNLGVASVDFTMPYLLRGTWEAGAYRSYGEGSFFHYVVHEDNAPVPAQAAI